MENFARHSSREAHAATTLLPHLVPCRRATHPALSTEYFEPSKHEPVVLLLSLAVRGTGPRVATIPTTDHAGRAEYEGRRPSHLVRQAMCCLRDSEIGVVARASHWSFAVRRALQ